MIAANWTELNDVKNVSQEARELFAFLIPGPIHLFWTTGSQFLLDIGQTRRVVLIVEENYRQNEDFLKLIKLPFVEAVFYLPTEAGFERHRYLTDMLAAEFLRYKPDQIYMHNRYYLDTQYAIHWAKKFVPNAMRLFFSPGRGSLNWVEDFKMREGFQVQSILDSLHLHRIFFPIVATFIKIKQTLSYFVNFKVIPMVQIGRTFKPAINVYSGAIKADRFLTEENDRDVMLLYLDNEIDAFKRLGIPSVLKVDHPGKIYAEKVFSIIHGDFVVRDKVIILPSYGYTSMLMKNGSNAASIALDIAEKWASVIRMLGEFLPGYEIAIKLHPAMAEDQVWISILASLKNTLGVRITLIDSRESAERHILESRLIVSDVSSTLWWTSLVTDKMPLSLDIFGYPCGDELKHYRDIYYVKDLSSLPKILERLRSPPN